MSSGAQRGNVLASAKLCPVRCWFRIGKAQQGRVLQGSGDVLSSKVTWSSGIVS